MPNASAFAGERTERRDVRANGLKTVIRIKPSVWSAFVKVTAANGTNTQKVINSFRVNNPAEDLPKAIEDYIKDAGEVVYSFGTREQWLEQAINALRPVFQTRGFPLPAKIRASVGFTSKGWRGKRIGECWSVDSSADGHVEIFLDPSKCTDARMLVNVLTHELVHAWQAGQGKKLGHGKDFKKCGEVMNLEGKAAHMIGGEAWFTWASPIIEALGPCPFGKMAEFMAKQKKQTTRMLKCECNLCGAIYRTSGKVVTQVLASFVKLNEKGATAHAETKAKGEFKPARPFMRCVDPTCAGGFLIGEEDATGEDDGEGE